MTASKPAVEPRAPFHAALFSVEAFHTGHLVEVKPLGSGSFGSVRCRLALGMGHRLYRAPTRADGHLLPVRLDYSLSGRRQPMPHATRSLLR
jgi:hypothetical protein